MVDVTLTIPDENVAEVIETIKWLQAIPQILDPEWVDPKDGTTVPLIDEYTGAQWAKEFIRRWLIQNIKNKRESLAAKAAMDAIEVGDDFIE